jgi:hypothetical protein
MQKRMASEEGQFLESRHIFYTKFVGFLKLYSDDYGLIDISKELEIDYKTVRTLFTDLFKRLHPELTLTIMRSYLKL